LRGTAPAPAYTRTGCQPRIVSHEAHLPTEEAQACKDAWVPRPDADTRRPHNAQAAPRKGPQATDRLMFGQPGSRSRPRRTRLSRSADFDRVFRHGRSHASRELVLYVFPRGERDGQARVGLSVSRKVGGAVDRNRVKRLLREAFAAEGKRLPGGTDAVVVARRDAKTLAEAEGLAGIQRALAGLIDRVAGSGVETALSSGCDSGLDRLEGERGV
jgi:ribonuclease P protein component